MMGLVSLNKRDSLPDSPCNGPSSEPDQAGTLLLGSFQNHDKETSMFSGTSLLFVMATQTDEGISIRFAHTSVPCFWPRDLVHSPPVLSDSWL